MGDMPGARRGAAAYRSKLRAFLAEHLPARAPAKELDCAICLEGMCDFSPEAALRLLLV